MPVFLNSLNSNFEKEFERLLSSKREDSVDVDSSVKGIISGVIEFGDQALLDYTQKFDRIVLTSDNLRFTHSELKEQAAKVSDRDRSALELAAVRIEAYHKKQLPENAFWTDESGVELGWRWSPVEAAGLYVPGGLASYPSSVLMNAIPAKVAGVQELIMVVPTPNGERNDLVLAAAKVAKVDRIFSIGGAQAIGDLAYGTETIPKVDKIVGPGNAYVAEAKRRVFGTVGIDMIAGPTELGIIVDSTTNPELVAYDLISQAEHSNDTMCFVITTSKSKAT